MILPVILAGGSGARLWPLSRQQFPKQFLTLHGDNSMLQATAQRLKGIKHQAPLVICHEEHRFTVAEQLRAGQIDHSGIILEPVARNTAPAIALAALKALSEGQDPLLLVLAADHVIKDEQAFCDAVTQAVKLAHSGSMVTFGIHPDTPETGYGYIRRGEQQENTAAYKVAAFVEKPDLNTAQHYLASGDFYWNSGMFMFNASVYLDTLKRLNPEIYRACEKAMSKPQVDFDFIRIAKDAFETCPSDSIDYAVMEPLCASENTHSVCVVPINCGWSDIGSWSSLWELADKDENGNVFRGDIISLNTKNTYAYAQDKLVATIGLEDIVVVETSDALLVSKRSDAQQVKTIVDRLKTENRKEYQHHKRVYRPWGEYDAIDSGKHFLVKRITVKPGAKLSLQMHHHRAEHWIVVAGTAKVTLDKQEFLLTENQSTYIPIGAIHALENPSTTPLELIEVQSGTYLNEDDIVRLKDRYGRS